MRYAIGRNHPAGVYVEGEAPTLDEARQWIERRIAFALQVGLRLKVSDFVTVDQWDSVEDVTLYRRAT